VWEVEGEGAGLDRAVLERTVVALAAGDGFELEFGHESIAGRYSVVSSPRRRGPIFQRRWLWVPAFAGTTASHRRLGHAGTRGERLFGGVLERLIRRQHHRGRAHLVVRRIDAGRRDAFLRQGLRRAHQAVARHDDPVVGGNEVLLGAVADRSHALLQRGVLHREAGDAAEGLAGFLRRAVDQIVVVLVGERPIGAGGVLAVHARAVPHCVDLAPGERAYRMKIVAPGPAILVVDGDPEVAVDRVIAARRDHG